MKRLAGCIIVASVVAYVALIAWAMYLYPGGTWVDPKTEGYDVWRNFPCDLLLDPALGGQANPGAVVASAAFASLFPGSLCFWLVFPVLFPGRPALGRIVRWLGATSVLGMLGVVLTPPDQAPVLHGIAVVAASGSGLAAAVLGVGSTWREPQGSRVVITLGLAALVVAGSDLLLYFRVVFLGVEVSASLSVILKFAAVLVLSWMVAVAFSIWRHGAPGNVPPGRAARRSLGRGS